MNYKSLKLLSESLKALKSEISNFDKGIDKVLTTIDFKVNQDWTDIALKRAIADSITAIDMNSKLVGQVQTLLAKSPDIWPESRKQLTETIYSIEKLNFKMPTININIQELLLNKMVNVLSEKIKELEAENVELRVKADYGSTAAQEGDLSKLFPLYQKSTLSDKLTTEIDKGNKKNE
jgi:hypothetical protein